MTDKLNDKALEAAIDAAEAACQGDDFSAAIRSAVTVYLAALPDADGLKLDTWAADCYSGQYAGMVKHPQGQYVLLSDAQAALQFQAETIARLERDVAHWRANHDEMVQRNAVLRERPDLPADRLPSIARYEAEISKLTAKRDEARAWAQKAEDRANKGAIEYVRLHDRAMTLEARASRAMEVVRPLLDQAEHVCLGANTSADVRHAAQLLGPLCRAAREFLEGGE